LTLQLLMEVCLCSTFLILLQRIICTSTSSRNEPHDEDEPETKDADFENPVLLKKSLNPVGCGCGWFLTRCLLPFIRLNDLDLVAVILEVLWVCIREEF